MVGQFGLIAQPVGYGLGGAGDLGAFLADRVGAGPELDGVENDDVAQQRQAVNRYLPEHKGNALVDEFIVGGGGIPVLHGIEQGVLAKTAGQQGGGRCAGEDFFHRTFLELSEFIIAVI